MNLGRLIALLSTHVALAFAGFLVMLVAALIFERNARRLGRAGMQQLTQSMRAGGLRDYFVNSGDKMRERFKRDE